MQTTDGERECGAARREAARRDDELQQHRRGEEQDGRDEEDAPRGRVALVGGDRRAPAEEQVPREVAEKVEARVRAQPDRAHQLLPQRDVVARCAEVAPAKGGAAARLEEQEEQRQRDLHPRRRPRRPPRVLLRERRAS
eukprot:1679807-Prymnesium_polylepis.1